MRNNGLVTKKLQKIIKRNVHFDAIKLVLVTHLITNNYPIKSDETFFNGKNFILKLYSTCPLQTLVEKIPRKRKKLVIKTWFNFKLRMYLCRGQDDK